MQWCKKILSLTVCLHLVRCNSAFGRAERSERTVRPSVRPFLVHEILAAHYFFLNKKKKKKKKKKEQTNKKTITFTSLMVLVCYIVYYFRYILLDTIMAMFTF